MQALVRGRSEAANSDHWRLPWRREGLFDGRTIEARDALSMTENSSLSAPLPAASARGLVGQQVERFEMDDDHADIRAGTVLHAVLTEGDGHVKLEALSPCSRSGASGRGVSAPGIGVRVT